MAGDASRQNGELGGRPPSRKNDKTLEREAEREVFQQLVLQNLTHSSHCCWPWLRKFFTFTARHRILVVNAASLNSSPISPLLFPYDESS